MIGQTISHYTVLEKLGAGGMGEIYKAQDTRLNRFVVIKVLSGGTSGDPERRRRFIQEAQAASALNHPNIITIYDVLSQDGVGMIVMEYIAGSTLDVLIPQEGMSAGKVLDCAVQMASALEAAHAAGIVHRDLKPGNVMVTATGLVKILDFGLAKLIAPTMVVEENDATLPLSAPLTVEGSILGTVSYMSPEQADARPVDARSDIFTFGVVLYEMLTGRKAFAAGSTVSTLSAILRDEPKPIGQMVQGVPAELDRIVQRAMRKDPSQRWQSMQEMRTELAALKQRADSAVLRRPAIAGAPKKLPKALALAAAGVLLLSAAAGGGWWWKHRKIVPAPVPVTQANQTPPPAAQDAPAPASADTAVPALPDSAAAPSAPDSVLTNQGVLDMLQAQVPCSVIVDQVKSSKATNFDLSTAEIIRLSKAGASAEVIEAMRNPKAATSSPAARAARPTRPAPAPGWSPALPPATPPADASSPASAPTVAAATPAGSTPDTPAKSRSITIYADLPLGITLTEDVAPNPAAGQVMHFVVARDFRVDDAVIVAKGTPVTGHVVAGGGGRKLLVMRARPTFKLSDVEAFDGTRLKIRATAAAGRGPKEDRLIEPPGKHDKGVLAPAGTHYQVYFEGDQTISIRPQ
ncbi:MAG: serine/threonine-protein kinase [Bryobacteraceae bacterium]